ncbi:hypothetical protein ACFQL4_19350 [Halosimplex aquaticum]
MKAYPDWSMALGAGIHFDSSATGVSGRAATGVAVGVPAGVGVPPDPSFPSLSSPPSFGGSVAVPPPPPRHPASDERAAIATPRVSVRSDASPTCPAVYRVPSN